MFPLADVNESSQTNVLNQALKKIEEEESNPVSVRVFFSSALN